MSPADGEQGASSAAEIDAFIARWTASSAGEIANFQTFARELCDLIGAPADFHATETADHDSYRFEMPVRMDNGDGTATTRRADLFRRDCFVCEAKQGSNADQGGDLFSGTARKAKGTAVRGTGAWDRAMIAARNQADRYARFLGWPPFLIVVDVGHVIELYADFSGTGQNGYTPFPDPRSHRIAMDDLHRPEIRERLLQVWMQPRELDPSRHAARVTREVAAKLAELARSLEQDGRAPGSVAEFLMRCLFTMFAEDVDLIPRGRFTELLKETRDWPDGFATQMESLWAAMDRGGPFPQFRATLRQFNGALYRNATAIALGSGQIELLIEAAEADWSHVEPAIFGTLLERALDPQERHKLGAHYTPRAYVERLVMPTIIEPLRREWSAAQATAMSQQMGGDDRAALKTLQGFHRRLATVRVLDPACGSGNFLYVTMEHMKRLEGEVIAVLADIDPEAARLELAGHTVTPEQFLGIEVNERAAVIAEMVLWIGFLQWHFRTDRRAEVPKPVLRNYGNIECRDAVLTWQERRLRTDEQGRPITHWDGRTTKPHPVTGREVPDETAQIEDHEYLDPRPATWPKADFIVGNPPFIGTSRMRSDLGDGYTEAVRRTFPKVPQSADYVMYWWDHAARLLRAGEIERFGLITTNSLRQTFNRRVLQEHMTGKDRLSLTFAIPDHPWVDTADGAAVRVAMTVAEKGEKRGALMTTSAESVAIDEAQHNEVELSREDGEILFDFTIGVDVSGLARLSSNLGVAARGVTLHGDGFIVPRSKLDDLGWGQRIDIDKCIRPLRNGRDLSGECRGYWAIDMFGKTENQIRNDYPEIYQHLILNVKPERVHNRRSTRSINWWIFGEPIATFRPAMRGIDRYIATTRTAKHRVFQFLDKNILCESKVIMVASNSSTYLAILSSRIHILFSIRLGGWLGVGNDATYNHSDCFYKFPFPDVSGPLRDRISALGEELDAHRKARQAAHPDLTMTGMYNVLEALREGRALTAKEKDIHEKGLVAVLKDIHDRLDAAVIEAYGWPADVSDDEILERLVALNRERAEEEARGLVRWLRPEYQNPDGTQAAVQSRLAVEPVSVAATAQKQKWPSGLPDQMQQVKAVLDGAPQALSAEQVASAFKGARRKTVQDMLATLAAIGQARETDAKRYTTR